MAVVGGAKAPEKPGNPVAGCLALHRRIAARALEPADLAEPRLDRRQAFGFDTSFVEEARISHADAAVGVVLGGVEDIAHALLAEILQDRKRAVVRLVGRDRRGLPPPALGILAKILARRAARFPSRGGQTQ